MGSVSVSVQSAHACASEFDLKVLSKEDKGEGRQRRTAPRSPFFSLLVLLLLFSLLSLRLFLPESFSAIETRKEEQEESEKGSCRERHKGAD